MHCVVPAENSPAFGRLKPLREADRHSTWNDGPPIGICDPDPLCLGRFSRFVTHYYRCPAVGEDPWAYLDFVVALLTEGGWEVLLPTHEQAFLFSRERGRIPPGAALAISTFQSFLQVQGKVARVRTLSRLSIPQPASVVTQMRNGFEGGVRFPIYLKADYATASTAVGVLTAKRSSSRRFRSCAPRVHGLPTKSS